MEIGNASTEALQSVQQAINMTMMRKSMNKDAQTVATLLDGMQAANTRIMEQSVTPHKGGSIDVRV